MAITMYGTYWCTDCKRAKQFMGSHRVRYDFVDIDADPEGLRVVENAGRGNRSIPVIEFEDGSILIEPSNAELAAKLGLQTRHGHTFHDLTVIGSGPAGLTAAFYAAREGLSVLVIERAGVGGQAGITERLDNFPGFPEGLSGEEFARRLKDQAERFGVSILQAQNVVGIDVNGMYRHVRTEDGAEYSARALVLAVGSTYRTLDIPGETHFIGSGVHFCATCDGPFYRGDEVLVIGGGNSAAEESLFLARFASKVTIATRGEQLRASQVIQEKIEDEPKITVLPTVEPVAFTGDARLRAVTLRDTTSGAEQTLTPAAVFVFIGLEPNTGFLRDVVELDQHGFVLTDTTLQTSVPGVFAAGDCRAGSTKQAASAVGEGATAALSIREYLQPHFAEHASTGGEDR